jgi:histidinol phosphatase-like enzyme (inositol monophosphatase family)
VGSSFNRRNIDHVLQSNLFALAHELAEAARQAILPLFRTNSLETVNKDSHGFDPVTRADKAAEKAIREILAQKRPEDGILGEEYANIDSKSGLTWVLDPIDGTRGFISGTPTWGVLIALADADGPFLGVVDQPFIGERFAGGFGKATSVGPQGEQALSTRGLKDLSEAILFTTFPEIGRDQDYAGFRAVHDQVKLVRYGLDCYAYALLAAGHIDLVIEAGLQPYDIQAPIALIEAAGGIVTNWKGAPAHLGGQVIAASNKQLLDQALAFLTPYAD